MAMAKATGGVRAFRPSTGTDEFQVPVEDEVGPDDDEGGDGDEDHGGGRPEPQDRQGRRNARYDGRLSAAEQRAQRAEEEAAAVKARLDAIERQQAPANQQRGPEALKALYDKRLKELNDEDERLSHSFHELQAKGALTPSVAEDYTRRAREIDEKRYEARHHYYSAVNAPPQRDPGQMLLEAEYSDILTDPRKFQWAKGLLDQRIAEAGKDSGIEIRREVLNLARGHFDPQKRKPDASQRDLYTSRPVGSGGPKTATVTVQMGAAQRKMAHATYPHLPKEKAEKLWASTAGKRAALKKQQGT